MENRLFTAILYTLSRFFCRVNFKLLFIHHYPEIYKPKLKKNWILSEKSVIIRIV